MPTLLRWPVSRVLVVGPSMVPTLRHGDALVVRRGAPVRPGDLVIARFPRGPDLLVVKRAIRPAGNAWWLEGDNPLVADDSRAYGPGIVLAKVLFRYWPIRRAQRH